MKIGIAYDTKEMYDDKDDLYYDFADEVSISQLDAAFRSLGHETVRIKSFAELLEICKGKERPCDLVYNTMEGISSRNREGFAPSLLEMYRFPFMGTDAFGLSLTLNKYLTKIVAQYYGIATPISALVMPSDSPEIVYERIKKVPLPHILKPNYEGNSSGIVRCISLEESVEKLSKLTKQYHSEILCEEFIFGKEITIPLIGNDPDKTMWAITTVDVQKNDSFWLDKNWKTIGDYHNIIYDVPDKVNEEIGYAAFTLFRAFGCRDFCRFDFRLSANGGPYFIEANPLPALFEGGSFDIMGRANGLEFSETLKKIIDTASERLAIPNT